MRCVGNSTQRMEAWKMGSRDLLMKPTETNWNFNLLFSMAIQFRSRSPSQSWSKPRSCKVGGLLPHPQASTRKVWHGNRGAWCFQPLSVTPNWASDRISLQWRWLSGSLGNDSIFLGLFCLTFHLPHFTSPSHEPILSFPPTFFCIIPLCPKNH